MLEEFFGSMQSITLNDSLLIQKDSLHIIGNGNNFNCQILCIMALLLFFRPIANTFY